MMLFVVMVSTSSGCTPEKWRLFHRDESHNLEKAVVPQVEIPDIIKPKFTTASLLEAIPDKGTLDLSVELAAMLALSRNRDLQVRQLNPVIAGTFEQIERGKFDPEIFAQFKYLKERTSETSDMTGEQIPVDTNDSSAVTGIRQVLPGGTTLETSISQQRSIDDQTPEEQSARIGLSITQSLLRGGGSVVNMVSVRQAELNTSATLYELRGVVEAMLAETEIAYWNFVLARKKLTIFEQSTVIAKQQLDEVEQQILVGFLPEVEAAAARAEVAQREQALIDARSLMEACRLKLLRQINFLPGDGYDLRINTTSKPDIEPEPIKDLSDRLALADRFRPDLNEARLRLKQNRMQTIVTRNGLLPRLELFAILGQTGYATTFPESFKQLDGNTYDFSFGLAFSHYLGNRSAKAADLAARVSHLQAKEALENLSQIVRLDVRLAVNEVERACRQISASRATLTLQRLTLDAEKERFKVGSSTSILIAQAQRDLLAAGIAQVMSIVNYRIALVRLNLAEGTLLERRGVRIAEDIIPERE